MGGVNTQPEPQSASGKSEEVKQNDGESSEEKAADKAADLNEKPEEVTADTAELDANKSGNLTEEQLSELLDASFVAKSSTDKTSSDYISYKDAQGKVDEFNSKVDTQLADATGTAAINKLFAKYDSKHPKNKLTSVEKKAINAAITTAIENNTSNKSDIPTAITTTDINKNEAVAKKTNDAQIADITKQIKQYIKDYAKYESGLSSYNSAKKAYIKKIKDLGLWEDGVDDPTDLSQLLSLKDEKQAKVTVKPIEATEENGSIMSDDKGNPLLTNFYHVNGDTDGDVLKVTYTNLKNSTYKGKKIKAMVVTYSDFKESNNSSQNGRTPGIYFGNNPLDGFFYVKANSVTVDIKMYYDYDKKSKKPKNIVKLEDNSAYFTVESLNSEGTGTKKGNGKSKGSDYVEKAQLLSDGKGLRLPESSVTVHHAKKGDILYSDKNNAVMSGTDTKDTATANKVWGKKIVKKYSNWDVPSSKNAIFGSGLFKVTGKHIQIKYSNKEGSAWAPFSTNIPKLTFDEKEPVEPTLKITWQPSELKLHDGKDIKDNKDVKEVIHYVYEDGETAKPDITKTVTLTRSGKQDQTTNETTWNDWSTDEFAAVVSPTIKGYTADKSEIAKQAADKDLEFTVTYSKLPDKDVTDQKDVKEIIHYAYEDGSVAKPDYSKTVTLAREGKQDQATDEIKWGDWSTDTFEAVTSPEIKGYTVDKAKIDKQNADKDLEFTVVYSKLPDKAVTDSKDITETIHYVYKDGSTAKPDYSKTVTLTRDGKQDQATDEITWSNWSTDEFEAVTSPEIKGYTADKSEITKQNADKDLEFIVVYDKLPDKAVTDSKNITETIHYVYKDGTTAKPDVVKTVTVSRQGKQDQATDEITWSEYDKANFDEVVSPEIKGYTADKTQIDKQTTDKDLVFTVAYDKLPDKDITDQKDVKEIIHYVYKDGSTAKPDYSKTVTLTRDGKQDQATDEITWDNWTTDEFNAVTSPEIKGYIADKNEIAKQAADKDLEFTVVYSKLPDKSITDSKPITETIHYVYKDGTTAKPDYSKVVTVTRDGKQDQATDKITWNEYDKANFDAVASPEIKGYTADKSEITKQTTGKDLEFTVVYDKLPDKSVTDQKDVKETIHYVYADGSEAKPDYTKTVTLTRDGKQDQATDEITWGNWSTDEFATVTSPTIKGYTADKSEIAKQIADKDLEFTVVYSKLPDKAVTDQKDIKEIIHYIYADGSIAKPDYTKLVTLTRSGKQDQVTDEITWGDWSTDEFAIVVSPTIKGYKVDQAQIDEQSADKDYEFTVTYSPDSQAAMVEYLDDDANEQLIAQSPILKGVTDEKSTYSTANTIDTLESEGYEFVSDDTEKGIIFDNDDSSDQIYYVHMKHGKKIVTPDPKQPEDPVDPSTPNNKTYGLTKTLSRDIYQIFNGEKKLLGTQSIDYTRKAIIDAVTKQQLTGDAVPATYKGIAFNKHGYSEWIADLAGYSKVDPTTYIGYTTHQGYTESDQGTNIVLSAVDALNKANSENKNAEVDFTYTANPQQAMVEYVDDDANEEVIAQSLILKGITGEKSGYSTADTIGVLESEGYKLVSDDTKDGIVFDNDDSSDQIYYVHLKHDTMPITPDTPDKDIPDTSDVKPENLTEAVTRTITYHYVDGHDEDKTTPEVINFEGSGTIDKVTGKLVEVDGNGNIIKDSNGKIQEGKITWVKKDATKDEGEFYEVPVSPDKGYSVTEITVDGKKVDDKLIPSATVNHTSADIVDVVTYAPVAQKAHIKFVDDDTGENGTVLGTEDVDGHTDEGIQFKNAPTTLQNYLNDFDFVSLVDETPQIATKHSFMLFAAAPYVAGKTQNVLTTDANKAINYDLGKFNNDADTDQQFVVHLKHHIEDGKRTKTIHQHVEYLYGEGDKKDTKLPTDVAQDFDRDLTYSENGKVDKTYEALNKSRGTNTLDDKTTWDESTIKQMNFDTVNSPKVSGYHFDKDKVDPDDVTINNSNWNDGTLDVKDQVRYYANPQTAHIKFYDDTSKKFVKGDDGKDFEEIAQGKTGEEITLKKSLPRTRKALHSIMDENDHTLPYLPMFNMFDVSDADDMLDSSESRKLADENSVQDHIGKFDDNDNRSQLFIIHVKTPTLAPQPAPEPKPTPAPETHKIIVTYKDDITGKTLDTKSLTGKSGESANYSTASTINTFEAKGYTSDPEDDETGGKNLVFSDSDQSYLVELGHGTEEVTTTKTITRTIVGKTPNGDDINVKQEVTLTKTDTKDKVTGEITKQGTWNTGTWNKYDVPQFDGYTSQIEGKDGVQVTEKGVTSDTPDEVVHVSYVAIPSPDTPTPIPDTPSITPSEDPQPEPQPNDPTPTPAQPSEAKKEVSQAPTPKTPKKKVVQSVVSKKVVVTPTIKKSAKTISITEKVAVATHTEKATPSKKQTTTESQNTLPQTGAKNENLAGMLGLMIASVGAIFGLAAGKKRKND